MIIPCELASRTIVPTVRAMIAKELSVSYKMKQDDIAFSLGITQSAVSQYLGNIRGKTLNLDHLDEVRSEIREIALVVTSNSDTKLMCQKCCKICKIIREKRLLCEFHSRLDPSFSSSDCNVCISTLCP